MAAVLAADVVSAALARFLLDLMTIRAALRTAIRRVAMGTEIGRRPHRRCAAFGRGKVADTAAIRLLGSCARSPGEDAARIGHGLDLAAFRRRVDP